MRQRAVTAALAWSAKWAAAADARERLWLTECFAPFAAEVRRRVLAAAGPGELAELQRQIDESEQAAAELGAAARREAKARAIAKQDAKVRQFRAGVERLGRMLERKERRRT